MASREMIARTLNSWAAFTGRTVPQGLPSEWYTAYEKFDDEIFEKVMTRLLHTTADRNFPMKGQFLETLNTPEYNFYRFGSRAMSEDDATSHQRPELIDPETTKQKRQAFFSRLREQAKTKSASSGVRHHDDPRYQALLELGEQLAGRNATPDATSLSG